MNWQQLKIQIIPEHVDFIEPQLLAAGAVSITYLDAEDQPVFQEELDSTPLWDSLVLCALFEEDTELGDLLSWLGGNASIVNRASLEVEKIEDQAWERSWMDNFSAMQFGEKLWICPSWQEPPDPSATNIMLDPGLAFGSGSHATTALCLQWLATQDLQGKDPWITAAARAFWLLPLHCLAPRACKASTTTLRLSWLRTTIANATVYCQGV